MWNRPTMVAVLAIMVSCGCILNDQCDGSPEIEEIDYLQNQIEMKYIPAFQSLYNQSAVEMTYSPSKKMTMMRKRLKKAKTPLAKKKVVLRYLQKYQNILQDLKKFELTTDVDIPDSTLHSRQIILENLDNLLNLAITEFSEAIEIESTKEQLRRFKNRKGRERPLLRLQSYGTFSFMTQNDMSYLNHLTQFLDYSKTDLIDFVFAFERSMP